MVEIVDLNKLKMHGMGSVTNALEVRGGDPEPTVGMGCTMYYWSDRKAGTVVEIERDKKGAIKYLVVQEDTANRTDSNGMSEDQDYTFEPNPKGEKHVVKFHAKLNKWVEVAGPQAPYFAPNGERISHERRAELTLEAAKHARPKKDALIVKLGERRAYHDFSF